MTKDYLEIYEEKIKRNILSKKDIENDLKNAVIIDLIYRYYPELKNYHE